jgi:hypothetical protein
MSRSSGRHQPSSAIPERSLRSGGSGDNGARAPTSVVVSDRAFSPLVGLITNRADPPHNRLPRLLSPRPWLRGQTSSTSAST